MQTYITNIKMRKGKYILERKKSIMSLAKCGEEKTKP